MPFLRSAAVAAALISVALPASARAATVAVEGDVLRVNALPGEANVVTIVPGDQLSAPGTLRLGDSGAPAQAGGGCSAAEAGAVSCPTNGVLRLELDLGDLDDMVSVQTALPLHALGGDGNDGVTAWPAGPMGGATTVTLDGGLGDDTLTVNAQDPLTAPASVLTGGEGNDTLTSSAAPDVLDGDGGDDQLSAGGGNDLLDGDAGDDQVIGDSGNDHVLGADGSDFVDGGDGDDRAVGGLGDDVLAGGSGTDVLLGELGADSADGGPGADSIEVRDRKTDTAWCGPGRDHVRAEVLDSLDLACERVDYGPPGRVGRLATRTGGGRFVPIPGQSWAKVDRRILPDVLYLIRRYHVRIGDGYATAGHTPRGEHPLGLAVDIYPGPGGSWADVGRLARWAEPRQNRPRPPFRWVGFNHDPNHGDPRHCKPSRGCPPHLHLSWAHSPGRPRHPVRTVWVWLVNGGGA
jgi:RTX calcium-binding nonapeptide repeat (4 copies)